jgi:type II secretory pathway pseudopilin PulG
MKIKKGITLIELILVIGLTSLVIVTIYPVLQLGINSFNSMNSSVESLSAARFSMDYIIREIRRSKKIEVKDNTIYLDNNEAIYLENGAIYHGNKKIADLVNSFICNKTDEKIDISLQITENDGQNQTLSATIYIR